MARAKPLPPYTPAVDQMVTDPKNLAFVRTVAVAYKKALPPFIELDDIIAAGHVGLIQAARRFDETRGIPFQRYALRRIRGEMRESIRRRNLIHTSTSQLDSQGADGQGVSEDASLLLRDRSTAVDDLVDIDSRREAVRRAIAKLDPEARRVLELRYYRGYSCRESSAALDLSATRVSQVHKRALVELRTRALESTFVKQKPTLTPAAQLEASLRASVVDELGQLDAKLAPLRADVTREAKLKEVVRAWAVRDGVGQAQPASYTGEEYVVTLSAQGNQRGVASMPSVFDFLGRSTFLKHCSIALKTLEVLIPAEKLRNFVTEGIGCGSRKLTIVPRENAETAAQSIKLPKAA